jgi:hypothetical protein
MASRSNLATLIAYAIAGDGNQPFLASLYLQVAQEPEVGAGLYVSEQFLYVVQLGAVPTTDHDFAEVMAYSITQDDDPEQQVTAAVVQFGVDLAAPEIRVTDAFVELAMEPTSSQRQMDAFIVYYVAEDPDISDESYSRPTKVTAEFQNLLIEPEPIRGYALDARNSMWGIVDPEASTNLITNPSAEVATTNYTALVGTVISQSSTRASRGNYSIKVEPPGGIVGGLFYSMSLPAGTYTFSFDLYSQDAGQYRMYATDNLFALIGTRKFLRPGLQRWQRFSHTFTNPSTQTVYLLVDRVPFSATSTEYDFWVDGFQLEEKGYATTYIDGDQEGWNLKLRQPNPALREFYWTGQPHESTSSRSARTRAGGRIRWLTDVRTMSVAGLGMANVEPVGVPLNTGGEAYSHTILRQTREFSLVGKIYGNNLDELNRKRRAIIQYLRPDETAKQQPVRLLWRPPQSCGYDRDYLVLDANYVGGLEGNWDNFFQETINLQFRAYDPMPYEWYHASTALTLRNVSTGYKAWVRVDGEWTDLTPTAANGAIYVVIPDGDGGYYAGGEFTTINGVAANRVAHYTGGAWTAMSTGVNGKVNDMVVSPDASTLYAVGAFTQDGGAVGNLRRAACWNGAAWAEMDDGLDAECHCISIYYNGDCILGGAFTQTGPGVALGNYIARYDPDTDTLAGYSTDFNNEVYDIDIAPNGTAYCGGIFTALSTAVTCNRIAYLADPSALDWAALGDGVNGSVNSVETDKYNQAYFAGTFTQDGTATLSLPRAAFWDGNRYYTLGGGVSGTPASRGLTVDENVQIEIVGAHVAGSAGIPSYLFGYHNVWTGTAWINGDIGYNYSPTTGLKYDDEFQVLGAPVGNGTAWVPAHTSVNNEGDVYAYPKFRFDGPGYLRMIRNNTTRMQLQFNIDIEDGETVYIDCTVGRYRVWSTLRGDITGTIAASNIADFALLPGVNSISVLVTGTTDAGSAGFVYYNNRYYSADYGYEL